MTTWAEVERRRNTKTGNYQDPTPKMLKNPAWNAIYEEIKDWDINIPSEYAGYCAATGNHATAIFNALGDATKDNYVAWLRWSGDAEHRHLVTCDSDSEGAFKVYRSAIG